MLGVITIIRLHAMYQQSRKMNIFFVVFILAVQIACVVLNQMRNTGGHISGDEYVLSNNHLCGYESDKYANFLFSMIWVLRTAWEVLALFLAVWIAVKHFRELPRSRRWAIGGFFTILIKTHVFYFASFVFVSCIHTINSFVTYRSSGAVIYDGVLRVIQVVQMFVLGPRLILGVREYYANLVANADEDTCMASIVFEERIHITTGGGV